MILVSVPITDRRKTKRERNGVIFLLMLEVVQTMVRKILNIFDPYPSPSGNIYQKKQSV
jgi:hypothetical protein